MKKQNKKHSYVFWVMIAFIAALIAAPNASIAKIGITEVGASEYNVMRLSAGALVGIVLILMGLKKFNIKNLTNSILSGVFMTIALITFVHAIKLSSAGYVAILSLMAPIYLVIISRLWLKETITKSAAIGIFVAATGGLFAVISVQGSNNIDFNNTNYLFATLIMFINSIAFPLSLIFARKANKQNLPIYSVFGVIKIVGFFGSVAFLILTTKQPEFTITPISVAAAIYSGIVVMVVARILNVLSYEHLSSATIGSFLYIESFMALLIIIFIVKEQVPLLLLLGGGTILLGVYLTQRDKMHMQHYGLHTLRHH